MSSQRKTLLKLSLCALLILGSLAAGLCRQRDLAAEAAALRRRLLTAPEPEVCALCGRFGDDLCLLAPCLIDLNTGEWGEMEIYPELFELGVAFPGRMSGWFKFTRAGGIVGTTDIDDQTCTITIPDLTRTITPELYCLSCRALLSQAGTQGYLFLDLRDPERPAAFPVSHGVRLEIGWYTLTARKTAHGLMVVNTGHLL